MSASPAGGIPKKNYHEIPILGTFPVVIQANKLKRCSFFPTAGFMF